MSVKKVFFSGLSCFVRALVKPTIHLYPAYFDPTSALYRKNLHFSQFYVDQLFNADATMQSTENLISYMFLP